MQSTAERSLCPVCSAPLVEINDWLGKCPECQYWRSTLESGGGRGVDGLESLRRDNFGLLLERLQPLLKGRAGAKLLEVGSAQGLFLEAADRAGFRVHGIEPAPDMQTDGLPVDHGFFPDDLSNPGPYDVIVFNDVFEHFADPVKTLRQVTQLLAPSGYLVLNLPMSSGILYRIAHFLTKVGVPGPFDRMWQAGLPSPHMTYFNRNNLTAFVTRHAGMRLVKTFSLPSMSRKGLKARVFSTSKGLGGAVQFAALWCLSFMMSYLPADIGVMIYQKSA